MKIEEIHLPGSRVMIGKSRERLVDYIPVGKKIIVITETVLYDLYRDFLKEFEVICVEGGEEHKTWDTVDRIINALIARGADRETFIVGFGGGIVCDVTGFVASVFMRGCRFAFVPTTLLAQADASVGGKNGINYQGYKNMIGMFRQPEFVLCDPTVFATLGTREYVAGFAEIVKAAIIADVSLFTYLEEHVDEALRKDTPCLIRLIHDSLKIKARIVTEDERESGIRRLLNLGHTFAHAIEKNRQILHGEAVSVGLCMAARYSEQRGGLSVCERQRVEILLGRLKLPIRVEIPFPLLIETMGKDKKKTGEWIHLILPKRIGVCEDRIVEFHTLEDSLRGKMEI